MVVVVSSTRRPVQLEGPRKKLGHAGQRGPQRGEGVSAPRSAAGCVRESRLRCHVVGESSDGRRQPCGHALLEGLQVQIRLKITDELRRIIEADNHEAVKIGDMENDSEAMSVVGANFDRETLPRRSGRGRGGRFDTSRR